MTIKENQNFLLGMRASPALPTKVSGVFKFSFLKFDIHDSQVGVSHFYGCSGLHPSPQQKSIEHLANVRCSLVKYVLMIS